MLRKILFVSVLPVLLAVMMAVGYPGSTPVVEAAGTPGALVPLGDQLGDVGQYYSGIAPSMGSTIYVQNTTGSSNSTTVYLYDDAGNSSATITCNIPANGRMTIEVKTGGAVKTWNGTSASTCTTLGTLHGVYHAKVVAASSVAVTVEAGSKIGDGVINRSANIAYKAVPSSQASTAQYPVAGFAQSSSSVAWDTDFIVYNVDSANTNTIQFKMCDSSGANCYWNNEAVLQPNERRIFSASQLFYKDNNGSLTSKLDTWQSVKITSLSGRNFVAISTLQEVVGTNGKIRTEYGARKAMAFEQPSLGINGSIPTWWRGYGANGAPYAVVYNAHASAQTVTATLKDANGSSVASANQSVAPGGYWLISDSTFSGLSGAQALNLDLEAPYNIAAIGWYGDDYGHQGVAWTPFGSAPNTLFRPNGYRNEDPWFSTTTNAWYGTDYVTECGATTLYGYWGTSTTPVDYGTGSGCSAVRNSAYTSVSTSLFPNNTSLYGKVVGTEYIVPAALRGNAISFANVANTDGRMAYEMPSSSTTWYVPFTPAPVVQFEWSTSHETGHPDAAQFGFSGNPTVSGSPSWASDMNWYVWPRMHVSSEWAGARDSCQNSRYLLMDKGLVDVSGGYNSYNRLNTIRNLAPSACAGRPLLLANEPNFTDQGNMTHVEVGRQVYVYRSWPGDLHSPAYGAQVEQVGTSHSNASVNDGQTLPSKTDYATFKTYWNTLSFGEIPYDSLATHFYFFKPQVPNGGSMIQARQDDIASWKDEATTLGVQVQVTEYGMLPITDTASIDYCPQQCIADRVDELSDAIKTNLGATERQLMWFAFISGVAPGGGWNWTWPDAFVQSGGSKVLTSPVGEAWESDADDY